MTKVTGVSLSGISLRHDVTYASFPGYALDINPKIVSSYVLNGSGDVIRMVDQAAGHVFNSGDGGGSTYPTLVIDGSDVYIQTSATRGLGINDYSFDWMHKSGAKFLVYIVGEAWNTGDLNPNYILYTGTSSAQIGYGLTYRDLAATFPEQLVKAIVRGVSGQTVIFHASGNNSLPKNQVKIIEDVFFGQGETGNDGIINIGGSEYTGESTANVPSVANSTYKLRIGGRSTGALESYFKFRRVLIYNVSGLSKAEIEEQRTGIKSLLNAEYGSILS